MTITLNLDADLGARLAGEAKVRGMALDAYVRALIERQEGRNHPDTTDLSEFRATLNALAEGAEQLPPLPPDSLHREIIYRDHD